MGDVRLIPLGVGDAFSARHYTTCFALGCGDDWLLIDCPHPVRKMLYEACHAANIPLDLANIRAVALSHLHADHSCGLEDYAYYSYFALNRKATLLAHPIVTARLWQNQLSAGMDQSLDWPNPPHNNSTRDDYFDIINLDTSRTTTFGPFAFECRETLHSVPTTAFRITANGRKLGFSADSAWDPTLIDWLSPCDLIIHEGTSYPTSRVHTPYHHLAALPAPLRAKMRLFHYPDDFNDPDNRIELLEQGVCYDV